MNQTIFFVIVVLSTLALMIVGVGPDNHVEFIEPGSLIFVGLPTAILFGFGRQVHGTKAAARMAFHGAWIMGTLGVLIGVMLMLNHLEDESALRPGIAVCLMTWFYALIIMFLCLPLMFGSNQGKLQQVTDKSSK